MGRRRSPATEKLREGVGGSHANTPVPAYLLTRRNLAKLAEMIKARPTRISDPRVQRVLADAFARGARLIPPLRQRGRPKLYDGRFSGEDDPRLERLVADLDILRDYETVLDALRSESVKQRKDETFDQWVSRLMPLARKAWEEFAWELGDLDKTARREPAADAAERRVSSGEATERPATAEEIEALFNRPDVTHTLPLSDDRLRVLVTRAIRWVARRRDSIRARLARCLVAQRWGVSLDNLGALRGRIERARKSDRGTG